MNYKRIIIVAYRIPFKQVTMNGKTTMVQNSGGLVSAIFSLAKQQKKQGLLKQDQKIVWLGYSESFFEDSEKEGNSNEDFEVIPIPLEKNLNDAYYGGFCNSTIWPLFHYYPYLTSFKQEHFDAYKEANERFYKSLKEIIQPGDFVWIHDYQLFLLPEMIRKEFKDVQLGFFLHIPFPSYEIFRLLPHQWQLQLLNGILGADLIGFHTNDYTQYFLRTVSRVLGYSASNYMITLKERVVKADSFPISIDFDMFHSAISLPEVQRLRNDYLTSLDHKKVIFSVDRLDYSKGLLHRLQGFEKFLIDHPEWHNRVTFVMVVVPSRDTILQYQEMKQEIEECVGRINGAYSEISWRPIVYLYRSLSFHQLTAWYNACDIALITPIRDGMNLVAKEFVASRKDQQGVLILSEMAGASSELNGSLLINPTAASEISEAILQALSMPPSEQRSRIEKMQKRIRMYDVYRWSEDFNQQLSGVKSYQSGLEVKIVNPAIELLMQESLKSSHKSLFFFDYDGTLAPIQEHPSMAVPDQNLIELLQQYSHLPDARIVIISGRDRKTLLDWFSSFPFILVSEHGAFIDDLAEGTSETEVTDQKEWKKPVYQLLQQYVDRCPGSFIENKSNSIAWHFRTSDPEFSFKRSRELVEELQSAFQLKFNLQVLEGNKVIEIKPKGFDKGSAAKKILERYPADFIFAAGDDTTDEFMFRALPEKSWTIKIGLQTSIARYNCTSQQHFMEVLRSLP